MKNNNHTPAIVNDRIKQIIKELKYDLPGFANRIGVSPSAVTNVVTAGQKPSYAMMENIHKILPVSEDWLFMGKGKMFTVPDSQLGPHMAGADDLDAHRKPDLTINNRIKAIREEQGLTQALFAGKLRITRDVITYLELGRTSPPGPLIKRIAEVYLIDPEWILFGDTAPKKYKPNPKVKGSK